MEGWGAKRVDVVARVSDRMCLVSRWQLEL